MLGLAGRAHDMFLSLDPDGKRRLVSLLISGSTWEGRSSNVATVLSFLNSARIAPFELPRESDLNSKIAAKEPVGIGNPDWIMRRGRGTRGSARRAGPVGEHRAG